MTPYDVTIGIPVYRTAPYVARALRSALSQDYPSIEYIIVDDGSDDDAMAIVSRLLADSPRAADVRVVTHAVNQGVAAARNRIISEARGEFLYFMDSDDAITPTAISLLVGQARRCDAEMAVGSYERTDTARRRILFLYPARQFLRPGELARYAYSAYGAIQASACNYIVRTDVLRRHRLHFVDADYWEDMVFTHSLVIRVSRAVLLPDVTYYYYCREGSLSRYQARAAITREEIMRNTRTVGHLAADPLTFGHDYTPGRCLFIAKTGFYMACAAVGRSVVPPLTGADVKALLRHPATLRQMAAFRQRRLANMAYWLMGRLPAVLSRPVVKAVAKGNGRR